MQQEYFNILYGTKNTYVTVRIKGYQVLPGLFLHKAVHVSDEKITQYEKGHWTLTHWEGRRLMTSNVLTFSDFQYFVKEYFSGIDWTQPHKNFTRKDKIKIKSAMSAFNDARRQNDK